MFDALPEAFGSYRVLEEIGAGRFGPMYRAQDAGGVLVAVEVFDQGLTSEQASGLAAALERLGRAPLDHPAIVPILSAGTAGDRPWLVEPWFDASPLDRVMRQEGPQTLGDVLLRITQVAGALDFAAAVGIHHGALHPRDILVSDDRTVLTGVGVLQALGEAGLEVPMEGAYVSPQRANGLAVTAQDDIFSLAAITFELVYGKPVPIRSDLRSLMTRLTGVDHTRFVDVLERSLSPDASERPATALEFAEALQRVLVEEAPVPVVPRVLPPVVVDDFLFRTEEPAPEPDLPVATPAVERDALSQTGIRPEPVPDLTPHLPPVLTPEPGREPARSYREPARSYGVWFPTAAALAIGILTGFASGFVVGQRDSTPTPYSAERAVPRGQRTAPEAASRDFTESAVSPQAVTEQPVIPPPERRQSVPLDGAEALRPRERTEETGRPAGTDGTDPTVRAEPADPSGLPDRGSLQVDSRPRGARVFLDGRLVGTTPLLVADVQPGTHAVRIDLSGHRRWVTSVEVARGSRQRVAASLER